MEWFISLGCLLLLAAVALSIAALVVATQAESSDGGNGVPVIVPEGFFRPSNVYAFGDSYNDPGNLYILSPETIENSTDPIFPVPDPNGNVVPVVSKQRFGPNNTNSNGLLAHDFLSRQLGLAHFLGFAQTSLPRRNRTFVDFSISGAQQGGSDYLLANQPPPSVEFQANTFAQQLASSGKRIRNDDLFILRTVGGNEFPNMAAAIILQGANPAQLLATFAGQLVTNLSILYQAGARNVMLEVFDVASVLPIYGKIAAVNPAVGVQIDQLMAGIRATVHGTLNAQQPSLWPDMNLKLYDMSAFRDWLTQNADQVGIIDNGVTISDQLDDGVEVNPNQRFWDDIHPSEKTNRLWAVYLHAYVIQTLLARFDA